MYRSRKIAIIQSDTLRCLGLQNLLTDYFPPVDVHKFSSYNALSASSNADSFDYYFTDSDTFVMNADFFFPRRNKTCILVDTADQISPATYCIQLRAPQESIIDQMQQLFNNESNNLSSENNKELSSREIDVLQLIVKGITNKEIADKLNISLNTVLTHRKNLTSKLGIKTVSGLTFYAIMNGFISGDEIEI